MIGEHLKDIAKLKSGSGYAETWNCAAL